MALGTITRLPQAGIGTAPPVFFHAITCAGPSSYATGGEDILTPLRAITHDKLDIVGILPQDAGGYVAAIVKTQALKECTNVSTYALADGDTLVIRIDREVNYTVKFATASFANIAAATAAEVAAAITAQLRTVGVTAAATTGATKVTVYGPGPYLQVVGGTANTALGFATTEAADACKIKLYTGDYNPAADSPLVEVDNGENLSGVTLNLLVIAK